ncbi:MAG: ribonuclease P protein component [Gammaproteobacteria bacterium]
MGKFTRRDRLLTAADFDRVFGNCRRSADELFTVLYRSGGLGYPRLGLAIAKKRIRRAVDRNRLKRLIRESFRVARPELPRADIIVMAREKAARADHAVLIASLERHWQRLSKRADSAPEDLH